MKHRIKSYVFVSAIVISLLITTLQAAPVSAAPEITLTPDSGAIGTRITISGDNFLSYVGDKLSIFFNDKEIADSPVTISPQGSFQAIMDIPDNAPSGIIWITVKGPLGSVLAQSSLFIPAAAINLDSGKGNVGTTITISGEGFYSDKMVTFSYVRNGTIDKLDTVIASMIGEFDYEFTIPESPGGKHRIIAENAQGSTAETEFEVLPSARIIPELGTVGDLAAVNGTGFGSNSEVTVSFQNTTVAFIMSDEHGNLEGAFHVPNLKSRTYDMRLEDEAGYTYILEFTITAGIGISVTTGNVGTEVEVSGMGFNPGGTVSVKYDNGVQAQATADDLGAFSASFEIPVSTAGEHTITATDGTTSRQITFTMESDPPPEPERISPENEAETESLPRFLWSTVTDLSRPVKYDIQIASDEVFSDILFEKAGIIKSSYTLVEEEKLKASKKETPYYWRVRAVDGASNEGQWSSTGAFYVASSLLLPVWAIIVLCVFVLLVIGFLIARLRRERY